MSAIEQHLAVLAAPITDRMESFEKMAAALPPLLDALRLVWTLSLHFSHDATMGSLLQRIGAQLCEFCGNRLLSSIKIVSAALSS